MSFDAYKRVRDAAKAGLESAAFASVLSTVATEHGLTLAAFRKVYKHVNTQTPLFPSVAMGKPRGRVDDLSSRSIATDCDLMLMPCVTGGDEDVLDSQVESYVTAICRFFTHYEADGIRWSVVGFDADEPQPFENVQLQTGAVMLTASLIESA